MRLSAYCCARHCRRGTSGNSNSTRRASNSATERVDCNISGAAVRKGLYFPILMATIGQFAISSRESSSARVSNTCKWHSRLSGPAQMDNPQAWARTAAQDTAPTVAVRHALSKRRQDQQRAARGCALAWSSSCMSMSSRCSLSREAVGVPSCDVLAMRGVLPCDWPCRELTEPLCRCSSTLANAPPEQARSAACRGSRMPACCQKHARGLPLEHSLHPAASHTSCWQANADCTNLQKLH